MKNFENMLTWELLMDTIDEFEDWDINNEENNNEKFIIECEQLAYYIKKNEDAAEKKSNIELYNMEKSGEIFSSHIFVRLAKHYFLENYIHKKDNVKKQNMVEKLHSILGNIYYFKAEKEIIKELLYLYNKYCDKTKILCKNTSYERIGRAANYLKKKGCDITIKIGEIEYDDSLETKLFDMMNKKIRTIGGMLVLKKVLKEHVGKNYVALIDRYMISRTIDDSTRNYPLNLLINLSVRHLHNGIRQIGNEDKKQILSEIFQIAEAWLDILNIQGESSIEYAFLNVYNFPYYLKNEMIFDKMCLPAQYSARFILICLDKLIKPWFDEYAKKEYTYKDYYRIAEYLLNQESLSAYVQVENINKSTKISKGRIYKILEDIALDKNQVNSEYTSLESNINLYTRPIIRMGVKKYIFFDQHFCGFGFYLAAYDMIKENYQRLDREQGKYVEQILLEEMSKKGYEVLYGQYPEQGGVRGGECDLVLVDEKINFFEIKKKFAIDEFNKVDDVSILNSLSAGMIRAQKQAFFHEYYLYKNKHMVLNEKRIDFDEKLVPAVKVSVCASEYSFLMSSVFSRTLINSLMCANFESVDEKRRDELKTINKLGVEIRKIVENTYKDPEYIKDPGFYSLFCSLQQILTAVWVCDTEREFYRIMDEWIYVKNKALDPYVSILYIVGKKMDPVKKRDLHDIMLECVKKRKYCSVIG